MKNWAGICFYRPKPKIYIERLNLWHSKKEICFLVHESILKYPNYLNSAKKKSGLKPSKGLQFQVILLISWILKKVCFFKITFVSLRSKKVCFSLLECVKNSFLNFFENYKNIPRTIFRALLMLGKLNFHLRETPFAVVYSWKISKPLKSKWRKIPISFMSDFFVTCVGNLAPFKHIK